MEIPTEPSNIQDSTTVTALPEDVASIAESLGMQIGADEVKLYAEAIARLETAMLDFPTKEEDRPPLFPTSRDTGRRPSHEEDPYNCFITRCFVKGASNGPLSGLSVGVKDNISVAGVQMTLGSKFMEDFIPDIDATIVTRLLSAGANITGKTNMDDFSRMGQGFGTGVAAFGRCLNPHAPDHLTGGSSSGSAAAVASEAVDLAIGGDQGGSIRMPSAWCGVVGLKPTFGLVPYTGVVGLEPLLDHVGPMSRTVEGVAAALECVAGPDGYDPRQTGVPQAGSFKIEMSKGIEGLRVGLLKEGFGPATEPDVESAVRCAADTLRAAGVNVREVSLPIHLSIGKILPAFAWIGNALMIKTYGATFLQGYNDTNLATALGKFLPSRINSLPPTVKLSLLFEAFLGSRAYLYYGRAQNLRRSYSRAYSEVFGEVDCLLMPTVPIKAPVYTPPSDRLEILSRTFLRTLWGVAAQNSPQANITGHPALTVPCGLSKGLPIGMMLVGPHFSDALLLRVAHVYEQLVDWKTK